MNDAYNVSVFVFLNFFSVIDWNLACINKSSLPLIFLLAFQNNFTLHYINNCLEVYINFYFLVINSLAALAKVCFFNPCFFRFSNTLLLS